MMFQITPLSSIMGARVTGLNLDKPLSCEEQKERSLAFLNHHLLCIQASPLPPDRLVEFSKYFGIPQNQLLRNQWDSDCPEVSILESTYKDAKAKPADLSTLRLSGWHTDDSYFQTPAKATVLQALEIPTVGGQTCFVNTRKAYEEMPENVKANIEKLVAIHKYDTKRASARAQKLSDEETRETEDACHPLVRTHEETGLKAIYFTPNRTDQVIGMDRKESDKLLDIIYAWVTRMKFQYHHEWSVGDILLWDNRCLLHSVNTNYPIRQVRKHQRILLKGVRPF